MDKQNYYFSLQQQEKLLLRQSMREKRLALSHKNNTRLSAQAAEHLVALEEWCSAQTIFLYVAHKGEIDTSLLLENAWNNGKTIYLPKCLDKLGKMEFFACRGLDDLLLGEYGIYEPAPDDTAIAKFVPDLVVVPGVAFSISGVRLGMGKGYYDRYFASAQYQASCLIGFCFEFQVVPHITSEAWDVPVQAICTENGLKRVAA